jgi:effector-binding domain-containing protein
MRRSVPKAYGSAAPCGGIFATELFADEREQATIYAAFDGKVRLTGRLIEIVVPAAELAALMHLGSHDNIDLAHGALATHVAQHAIAIDKPIREYHLAGPPDVRDTTAWRTEVCWPVFHTAIG